MNDKAEFVTVNLILSEKGQKAEIREQTIAVENIESFRKWHNKGNQGLPPDEPMCEVRLKQPITKRSTSRIILVNEDFDQLRKRIGD